MEELQRQLTALLQAGLVHPSASPYAAPILFVRKKSGELRMAIDYCALNQITIKDKFPVPRLDELLDRLRGATGFTSLGLTSRYHQVESSLTTSTKLLSVLALWACLSSLSCLSC